MADDSFDLDLELLLDANSVAGVLQEVFGSEMTVVPSECAGCGNLTEIGSLLAYTHGPGIVLRCPACKQVMLRIVQTPDSIFIDARGVVYLRINRKAS
jgi:Family of unknown function (DUF6510)